MIVVSRILLAILCSLSIHTLNSETDSWTYRHIPLADASTALNKLYNESLTTIIQSTNAAIKAAVNTGQTLSDTDVEYLLALHYYLYFFSNDKVKGLSSLFEICIDTGTCKGEWQTIERIALQPEESVFYRSDYSTITRRYLASQIVACQVRFSTDKLTHIFKDGFNFFNYERQNAGFGIEAVQSLSELQEQYAMGGTTTGVVSHADITANLAGYRLLQAIFSNHITRAIDTGELTFEPVDLCQYITEDLDETHQVNRYVASKAKVTALKLAINRALTSDPAQEPAPAAILARRFTFRHPNFIEKMRVLTYTFFQSLFSWEYRKALHIYYNNRPIRRGRQPFTFRVSE